MEIVSIERSTYEVIDFGRFARRRTADELQQIHRTNEGESEDVKRILPFMEEKRSTIPIKRKGGGVYE